MIICYVIEIGGEEFCVYISNRCGLFIVLYIMYYIYVVGYVYNNKIYILKYEFLIIIIFDIMYL